MVKRTFRLIAKSLVYHRDGIIVAAAAAAAAAADCLHLFRAQELPPQANIDVALVAATEADSGAVAVGLSGE